MTTVGHYRLLEVQGVGSFATVHRAVDERLGSDVVVKILAENHSLNPEIRERFISEGRHLRRVRSPHVVTVHDIGESERQQPYLVLELADRGSLAERVAALRGRGWSASPADVLAVARPLAAAVAAVHAARLVHRDLSPGNVLLTTGSARRAEQADLVQPDERLVVADLGLCKDLAVSSGLTVAGGTTGFRPPEQSGTGVVDTRADLWALSALVRWLVVGAELPAALGKALDRSLAADPRRRHRDVDAWLADVEAALAPVPEAPDPAVARPRRIRRPVAAAALTLALFAGAGIGAAVTTQVTTPPASTADASLGIAGPTVAAVGSPTTFAVDATGLSTWAWQLPDGRYVVDEDTVTVTATSAGGARVVLRGRGIDGTELEAVHQVRFE